MAFGPAPTPLHLRSGLEGLLGGTLLTSFPFRAGEILLVRCILQGSLGQKESWGSALKASSKGGRP